MTDENHEQQLRLAALSLAHEGFQHLGSEIVVTAAEEYTDFLLAEYDDDDLDGPVPLFAPDGAPIVSRFHLTLDAVIYLGTLLATALDFGAATGVPEDNAVTEFGVSVLHEINDTLGVYLAGARV